MLQPLNFQLLKIIYEGFCVSLKKKRFLWDNNQTSSQNKISSLEWFPDLWQEQIDEDTPFRTKCSKVTSNWIVGQRSHTNSITKPLTTMLSYLQNMLGKWSQRNLWQYLNLLKSHSTRWNPYPTLQPWWQRTRD